jgi:5-hydroxyisourate hydrolase
MSADDGGRLTTHVLDTALGRPASGLVIELFRIGGGIPELIKKVTTDSDGRCGEPLLEGAEFETGEYELRFLAGDYMRSQGIELPSLAFLDVVPIRFGMAEATHYHVPLLLSPYGYSTYRGS